ncbi:hypothetical protein [Desulfocastanea catecholica]
MMAQRLITAAAENGIVLIPTGNDPHVSFRGQPDTQLLNMIAEHKAEIIEVLKARTCSKTLYGRENMLPTLEKFI